MGVMSVQEAMRAAVQLHQAGRLQEAEAIYRQVLEQVPGHPDALHLMGVLAHQTGRHERAVELIGRAIRVNPGNAFFHNSLGEAYRAMGSLDSAVTSYERAIALRPDYAEGYSNLGNALVEKGQLAQAIAMHRKAVELRPDLGGAYNNLGLALRKNRQPDEAIAALRKAIVLQPGFADAYVNLGNALYDKGCFDEAIDAYRKAIQRRPNHLGAYINLGSALREKDLDDEAVAACQRAIAISPDSSAAHYYLGLALRMKGRLDEAIAAYDKAIQLQPDFAEAHWNRSLALLLNGDLERAWAEYEWRWRYDGFASPRRDFPQPRWKGEDPSGRTILLHSEQGLGDTIQAIRYAPRVARLGARVIVECQAGLKSLIEGVEGVERVLARGEPLPEFDLHSPMLSLPLAFGTTLETIPADVPYIKADPSLVETWRKRLGGGEGVRVGLVWAGSPAGQADRLRSVSLSLLAPLAPFQRCGARRISSSPRTNSLVRGSPVGTAPTEPVGTGLAGVKGMTFYSLQKGEAAKEARNPPTGMRLVDLTGDIENFADTAALIANLDLVVSVDTAVAHLAGAMARPVWTLLPFVPDWRWMLGREDSPWYPTMRLFRQAKRGDWAGVVERVARELRTRVQGSGFGVQ